MKVFLVTGISQRSTSWKSWVSVLLLLATMINYMDRQTLSNLSERITQQFQMSNAQYGYLELVFGIAFAIGSLVFGMLADRMSVRLLYPLVLIAWSAVGIATGLTRGFPS
ncbi:MAG: MFS transporter, partial [Aureliella sp.]